MPDEIMNIVKVLEQRVRSWPRINHPTFLLPPVDHEYHRRKSVWDEKLQTGACTPLRIIFETSKAFESSTVLQQNDGSSSIIPREFWTAAVKDLNGGFRNRYYHDATGYVVGHDTWCCFKVKQVSIKPNLASIVYFWQQAAIFIRWRPTEHSKLVLCLDSPRDLQTRLQHDLPSIDPSDPYAWHGAFLDGIKKLYDISVWSLRDLVRDAELTRGTTEHFQPDFPRLHEIARHIIHSNETLDIAMDTVNSIIHEHNIFGQEHKCISEENHLSFLQVQRRLYSLSKELNSIRRRSISLNERLQNEINLVRPPIVPRPLD